jgi:hypothetical protein
MWWVVVALVWWLVCGWWLVRGWCVAGAWLVRGWCVALPPSLTAVLCEYVYVCCGCVGMRA